MAKEPIICVQKGDLFEPVQEVEQEILFEDQMPVEERLENKAETLADDLLNDAKEILKTSTKITINEKGEEVVKHDIGAKKYAAQVVAIVAKMVQGKQGIKLKRGEEARNNASFLMDLLKKAQSGRMTSAELAVLAQQKPISAENNG